MPANSRTAKAVTKQTIVREEEKIISGIVAATKKAAAASREELAALEGPDMFLQFGNSEVDLGSLEGRIREAYIKAGNKASSFKNVKVYVKPEENAAYYVVDQKFAGSLVLFPYRL